MISGDQRGNLGDGPEHAVSDTSTREAPRFAQGTAGAEGTVQRHVGTLPEQRLAALASRLAEKERELRALEARYAAVIGSAPWRALAMLWRVRLRLAPHGSRREFVLRAAARVLRMVAHPGRTLTLRRQARRRRSAPQGTARPPSIWKRGFARVVRSVGHGARPGGAVDVLPPAPPPGSAQAIYQRWIAANEPDQAQLELQGRISKRMSFRPLISVITPVFNPPPDVLRETIASVLLQTYDNWELILVDAASNRPGISAVLEESCASDARVHLISLDANLGISGNTNRGLAVAQGEFVAFLDHDDLLAPDVLYEVTRALNENPSLEIVYFDEDKVSEDGRVRTDPFFKPSWSPEYLLSTNYLMHSVIRREAIAEVGGLDPAMDGAQDWDLALRLAERGRRGFHIPRVLYHWRRIKGSVAADATAKMWAFEVQDRCLKAHMERRGFVDVKVASPTLGVVRVNWAPSGVKVSVIIPTKDKVALLRKCIASLLRAASSFPLEVLIIDTGSVNEATFDYYSELREQGVVHVLEWRKAFNYSAVNNFGAQNATGDVLVFLNNDVEGPTPGWLDELVQWTQCPEIGCVGARLLFGDGTVQHAGIVMGLQGHGSHIFRGGSGQHRWGVFGTIESYRNYSAVTGACLAVRRDVFDQARGFDERYELCYGDIDLCLRVAANGYRNIVTPFAELLHHEGRTRGLHFPKSDVLRASLAMFPLVVQGDPYFSPNLSYDSLVPATTIEDEPEARAARIMSIAESFGIYPALEDGLERELALESQESVGYEELVNRPVSRGPASSSVGGTAGSPLRVLMILHDLSRSGAPMVCLHVARFLIGRGHSVTVGSPKEGRLRESFEEAGARVVVNPLFLGAPNALVDFVGEHDVIIANTILAWRAVLVAKSCGRGVLWLIHESKFGENLVRQFPAAGRALAWADAVVFPSRETATLYRDFDGANHRVIHYGLDLPVVEGGAFAKRPGKLYVLTVASVERRKGQDILVEAAALLPSAIAQDFEFVVVGRVLEEDFWATVRPAAEKAGNVRFEHETAHSEILKFFEAADIVVCSSRDDPSPVVVLEAMGLGKAIVSTRVGAMPEIIEEGVSGLIVEKESPAGLASALVRLHGDRELLRRLGQGAKATFDRELSLARYGCELEAELQRISGRETALTAT